MITDCRFESAVLELVYIDCASAIGGPSRAEQIANTSQFVEPRLAVDAGDRTPSAHVLHSSVRQRVRHINGPASRRGAPSTYQARARAGYPAERARAGHPWCAAAGRPGGVLGGGGRFQRPAHAPNADPAPFAPVAFRAVARDFGPDSTAAATTLPQLPHTRRTVGRGDERRREANAAWGGAPGAAGAQIAFCSALFL